MFLNELNEARIPYFGRPRLRNPIGAASRSKIAATIPAAADVNRPFTIIGAS
jgi:hypothetical protein